MGYCSAPNCSNRTSPSMKLYKFPADPERRKKWLINCRRDNWIPGSGACLCQVCELHFTQDDILEESVFRNIETGDECVLKLKRKRLKKEAVPSVFPNCPKSSRKNNLEHFHEDQFEQRRLDQLKKLKPCAVPTIFSEGSSQKRNSKKSKLKNAQKNKAKGPEKEVSKTVIDYVEMKGTYVTDIDSNKQNGKIVLSNGISQIVLDCDMIFNDNNIKIKQESCEPIENVFLIENEAIDEEEANIKTESFNERNIRYMCNLNQLKMENKELKNTIKSLEKFLHKDQLEFLTKAENETVKKWSKDCITTCLKLKSVLGWNGYEFLLSMGYPGPSRQTLCRHLKKYSEERSAPKGGEE